MRLSVIQMDMRLGESAYNFAHAEALLRRAAAEGADTALLPETWNTGFFPADHLPERSDRGGEAVKALCAPLARELNMNIVAGSVSDRRGGACTTPPMSLTGRARVSQPTTKRISLPRWASTSTTPPAITSRPFRSTGTNAACSSATTSASPSFSARWRFRASSCCSCPRSGPAARRYHWETLTAARAIENQFFLAACNSCGTAGETVFGGASRILGPRGELLAAAGASEEIVTAALDFSVLAEVRNSINVFHDRRPELYRL